MNIGALTAQTPVSASLLAAQGTSASASPSSAQLKSDRNALLQQGLMAEKNAGPKMPTAQEVKKAASQFEAIIMRQLLAPTIEPIMSGGMGAAKDSGGGIYGYMLTDVLANGLSAGGGLGWARMLEKQLSSPSAGADIKLKPLSKPSTDSSPL